MPSTTSKNLGQVAAIVSGTTPPTNLNILWLDTSGATSIKKYYDPISQTWIPLTQGQQVAGDNWGTQVVQTDPSLTGNGTSASPLGVTKQGAVTGQVLTWNGTTWVPQNVVNSGLAVVTVDSTLKGNGTTGSPIGINPQGATPGQYLQWNGTTWVPASPPSSIFQTGMIIMWSGTISTIPSGWALCDGTLGTPNLQGSFIVGMSRTDPDYNYQSQGGAKTLILQIANLPAHSHPVLDSGHSHPITASGIAKSGNDTQPVWVVDNGNDVNKGTNTFAAGTKIGSSPTGISVGNTGSGQPFDKRPPYYALALIMKL